MRKYWILTAAAVLLIMLSGCGEKPTPGFPGKYEIEGFEYFSILNVSKTGEGCYLAWQFAEDPEVYGIGVELDSVLAVVQVSDPVKIMAYESLLNGRDLSGIWVTQDMEGLKFERTEDTRRLKHSKHDLTGTYTLQGATPDGEAYQGTLTLTRTKFTHVAHWEIEGRDPFFGIGFTVDSLAILGYGSSDEVGVGIYKIGGGKLEGYTVTADPAELNKKPDLKKGKATATLVSRPEPEETAETEKPYNGVK